MNNSQMQIFTWLFFVLFHASQYGLGIFFSKDWWPSRCRSCLFFFFFFFLSFVCLFVCLFCWFFCFVLFFVLFCFLFLFVCLFVCLFLIQCGVLVWVRKGTSVMKSWKKLSFGSPKQVLSLYNEFVVNGSQLAKMKKSIPHMSLPWNL